MKRVVTGAHYGLRDWLAQRITAVIMAACTVLAACVLLSKGTMNYAAWRELFSQGWVRVATLLFMASLVWHAWVGVRNILMDYLKPVSVRLTFQVVVIVLLVGYIGWTIQVLWGAS